MSLLPEGNHSHTGSIQAPHLLTIIGFILSLILHLECNITPDWLKRMFLPIRNCVTSKVKSKR